MCFFVIIFHYSFYKHDCLTPCLFLAAGLLPPNYYKADWNTYCRRMGEPKGEEWNTSKFTVTLECLPSEFNQATAWEQRSTCVSHDAPLLHTETPRMAAGILQSKTNLCGSKELENKSIENRPIKSEFEQMWAQRRWRRESRGRIGNEET